MADEITVEEAYDELDTGPFQWSLLLLTGFGFLCGTIEILSISMVISSIENEFRIEGAGILLSFTFVGEVIGGMGWGYLADKIGRLLVFKLVPFCSFFFGATQLFVPNYQWLTVLRVFLGIATAGNFVNDLIYFMEFLPTKKRGRNLSFLVYFGVFGIVALSFLRWITQDMLKWRSFLFLCSVPSFFLFAARLFWTFESPRFLLCQNNPEKARQVLNRIALSNKKPLLVQSICLVSDKLDATGKNNAFVAIGGVFGWQTMSLCTLWFFLVFGFYALVEWAPKYQSLNTGSSISPLYSFLFMGLAELPGLGIAGLLLDSNRFGRSRTLMIGMLSSAFFIFLFSLVTNQAASHILLGLGYSATSMTWASAYVYTAELYPTSIRSTVLAYISISAKTGGILASPAFLYFSKLGLEAHWIINICSLMFLFGTLFAAFSRTKTANKQLKDCF